jgi:hypothetical protein
MGIHIHLTVMVAYLEHMEACLHLHLQRWVDTWLQYMEVESHLMEMEVLYCPHRQQPTSLMPQEFFRNIMQQRVC